MRHHLRADPLKPLIALLLSTLALTTLVSATPSQFCRQGLHHAQVDFCMAVSLYHNHSSAAHDLYLKLSVRRPAAAAAAAAAADGAARLGWTAVGTGSRMHGSLMFVVYGDPEAQPPALSLRTTEKKHSAPVGIHASSTGTTSGSRPDDHAPHAPIDARLLDARWVPSSSASSSSSSANDTWTAELAVVCYSCSSWDGDAIAVESPSQPWIWAWNPDQDMSPYADDVPLRRHPLAQDGFGLFYVDMKSAATHHADDAMPLILPGSRNIHTSETPIHAKPPGFLDSLTDRPLAHLHGLLMSTAFLLLFPAGAVSIRTGSPRAFTHHWAIQLSALALALAGAATAIYMTRADITGSPHQIAGSAISLLLLVQAFLGWRHHIDFLRIRRRSIVSYAHISLGFLILGGGWLNLLGGIVLFGYGKLTVILAGAIVAAEALCVAGWSLLARRRQRAAAAAKETPDAAAAYFALDDIDSDDDDDDADDDDDDDEGAAHGLPREEQKGLMTKSKA